MNYLEQIKFNKDCISLYMQDDNPNSKQQVYLLLQENIEYYRLLNKRKHKTIKVKHSPRRIMLNHKQDDFNRIKLVNYDYITQEQWENELEFAEAHWIYK